MSTKNLALINNLNLPSSPLPNDKQQQLAKIINQMDSNQSLWLSGYLAARAEFYNDSNLTHKLTQTDNKQADQQSKLTVLYGSQTGNGKSIAEDLQQQAKNADISTEIFSLADFKVKQLAKKSLVTLVISTHGEGEAPDDAEAFHDQLFSKKAPDLSHLKYSVLALGDSSYEMFCQTGLEIDERLTELGGKRIHQRIDCDVDFESAASKWIEEILSEVKSLVVSESSSDNITALPVPNVVTSKNSPVINKLNPFLAEISTIQKITARDSIKDTYHIELSINPDLIQYQPGDSVGVVARNNSKSVDQILSYWQLDESEPHTFKTHTLSIRELLVEHIEITQLSKPFIQFLAKEIDNKTLQELATSHASFLDYCQDHQLLDLLLKFDPEHKIPVQDILNELRSITPRLYSIASSQTTEEDEIHLTINLEPATTSGQRGLASGLLCDTAEVGDEVAIYIEPNQNFRLPENDHIPVIMIGPGTGIAPFRAFLQQREASGAQGGNWLFFGNPNFSSDFLYQAEWLKMKKSGLLDQISVAFSRDQTHKIYVQDRLKDQAKQIWEWLEKGAHIYVCGDAKYMAKDVERTLIEIIEVHGKLSTDDAKNHLKTLKQNNRYQKDVY